MEDDGPNFSYAYGGDSTTSPTAPSWNPALRPNHESPDNLTTIAPDQQPSPQIIPESKPELDQELDDEDELPTISAASTIPTAIPTHVSNGVPEREREPTSDDDFYDRYGSGVASQSAPPQPEVEINGHGVNGAEADELVEATQGLSLGHDTAEDAHTELNGLENDESEAESSDEDPAQQYEHQGETTLLEDAVAENADAPLIADEEPTTDDWGMSGEVFDLGGMPQDAPLETPLDAPLANQAAGGGATVGDEVIRDSNAGGNTGEDTDWGTEDRDDFFGRIASQPVEPQPSTEQSPGAHVVLDANSQPATGAGSDWDIPLDDDFLPDAEDTPLFELDDDEGFLEDEPSEPAQPVQALPSTSRYAPQTSQAQQPPVNAFGAPAAQFNNFATNNQKPATTPSFPHGAYNQASPYMQQPVRPTIPSSAQSFADKAKGGYSSPYDLPDDVITPRRRPAHRTTSIPASQPAPPPPRTSSISNAGAPVPPPSNMSAASLSPPPSGHSMQPQMSGLPPNAPPKPATPARTASSDFFAELPVAPKPRTVRHHTSHVASQPPAAHGYPPKERTASWSSLRNEVRHEPENLVSQLQQPERLPVFPDQPTAPVRSNSLPVPQPPPAPASNRYSPAPAPGGPAANARYSPAPPTANARYSPAPPPAQPGTIQGSFPSTPPSGPPRPPAQPYAPRTSSPLAFHTQPHPNDGSSTTPEHHASHVSNHHTMHSAEGVPRVSYRTPLEGVNENEEQTSIQSSAPQIPVRSETPPTRSIPSSAVSSPRKKGNYTPQYQPGQPAQGLSVAPPPRAQSQSPSATMKQFSGASYERPASAHGVGSQPSTFGAPSFGVQPATQHVNTIPHRRQMSLEYDFIAPTDERAADPLQRWKGAPVFTWGLGGTLVTTFPKQIPRYGGGATMPMMKCCPGEVKIRSVKDSLPVLEDVARFPGPLKAKGKKKDVLSWLAQRIEAFEKQLKTPGFEHSLPADDLKRLEEKVLLWKILQVHVDNDGQLTGNKIAEAAVRQVLSPASETPVEGEASFSTAADLVGRRSRSNTAVQADPVDPRAVEELRTLLTKGDREKAVWHAVDQRLWAHAMLLSSTLNKDVWKQVVQEFVRKEVKKMGRDNQALAVLYEVFAGNHDDCIDELVPASARAGFQMMSTDGGGATQNALQGLDKWQETLSLVLNNRSEGDAASLLSLGRLLAGYGRVEAAHICFIFARAVTIFSGVDDAQADIVLIGADHRQNPLELGVDLEPVLLTEVYEFGLSLSAPGGTHIIPHLQNYKLSHAYRLAEYGHRADAQAYCDAIAAAMKATTRVSPYYNGSFIAVLDDLTKRLSQSPKDGSSSWISKPSMDKVSSSLLSKFNNFIAGDNDDAASNSGTGAEVGPFAKFAGSSPTLSPTASNADLYSAMSGQFAPSAPAPAGSSRYAPSNTYAPRASLESTRPQYASQGRPSMESDGGMRTFSDTYLPSPTMSGPYTPSQSHFSPSGLQPQLVKSQSYSPLRAEHNTQQLSFGSPYQPSPVTEEPAPSFGGYQPSANFDDPSAASTQPPSSYEPPSSTYDPPTNSYEPPAYEPYKPDDDEDNKPSLKPKKSIMDLDDDDDLVNRAASLKINGKSNADKEADEAFRKAAEEDAKRDKDGGAKKGWFGGWFKKDPNAGPGPIKAKLGEESSFYYDADLKKWVNKKGGATEATKPMATPPPPRSGPPSRAVSGTSGMGPPSSLPGGSHLSAPPTRAPTSNPQRSSSMPPPMGLPTSRSSTPGVPSDSESGKPPVLRPPMLAAGSGPPSRPGTGMSTASSIDDLLGAPQARKGPAAKKKKGGRYVDVMAQN